MSINNLGPFEAEVWGTVSDWVMVIVTSGTLYFIIRTFRSQLKVQQLQQQYTLIENEKFRREIVPVFELLISKTEFDKEAGQVTVALLLDVILTKNECNDLQIGLTSIIYKPEIIDVFPIDSAHVPTGHTINDPLSG